jgi:hypothetical protein
MAVINLAAVTRVRGSGGTLMFRTARAAALGFSLFLAVSQGAVSAPSGPSAYITFSLNTQDFSYPHRSADLLRRVVPLHERLQVPVDVYLTTTMIDLYETQAPDLLAKLKSSPWVAVSYHVRPPSPYNNGYDWLGLAQLPPDQQVARILSYETHGLDLTTGQPTTSPGGFSHVTGLFGAPPWVASALPVVEVRASVHRVFRQLGACDLAPARTRGRRPGVWDLASPQQWQLPDP